MFRNRTVTQQEASLRQLTTACETIFPALADGSEILTGSAFEHGYDFFRVESDRHAPKPSKSGCGFWGLPKP